MSARTPRVYNKRAGAQHYPADAVYVGRPTEWGNPYRVGAPHPLADHVCSIEQGDAVVLYRAWIFKDEMRWLRHKARATLRSKDLLCWCAPLPCHADILLVIANTDNDLEARKALGL